jgi:agmatinase
MKLEYADHDFKTSDLVVIGFPYDRTASFLPGARFAPEYIRLCTTNIEGYSPYQNQSLDRKKICDLGDHYFRTADHIADMEREASRICRAGKRAIFLGGEHTITYPVVKAIRKIKGSFSVIQFDAHADLRDSFHGEKISHACVLRRVSEVVGVKNIYQFGIRSGTAEEFSFHKQLYKFEVLKPLKKILHKIKDPVYLTIDVDVLDPGVLPCVGTPEPGGISFKELLASLMLFKGRKIVGADIVEYNPLAASPWVSGSLVAEILRELVLVM